MNTGSTNVGYSEVINLAVQVRPDLEVQIRATPEQQFNEQVQAAINLDLTTPQKQVDYISGIYTFAAPDLAKVSDCFTALQNIEDPNVWGNTVNDLIAETDSFSMSADEKTNFIGSLQILRSSYALWSS